LFVVKEDTILHSVLTYRVMPVCKYSHTRTCLCHLISICFMTSVCFHANISTLSCSCTSSQT